MSFLILGTFPTNLKLAKVIPLYKIYWPIGISNNLFIFKKTINGLFIIIMSLIIFFHLVELFYWISIYLSKHITKQIDSNKLLLMCPKHLMPLITVFFFVELVLLKILVLRSYPSSISYMLFLIQTNLITHLYKQKYHKVWFLVHCF